MNILSREEILKHIVDVKDFPKPGILFKDITPLFETTEVFQSLIHHLCEMIPADTTKLVAVESRGFLLASAMAFHKKLPFCLVRKPNKLPRATISETYDLEYGSDQLHIHKTSLSRQDKVLIVDDVLATGGTASAVERLCEHAGVDQIQSLFLMSIPFLKGTEALKYANQSWIKTGE